MSNHIDAEYRNLKNKVILFFKGYSMGAADIIPGVSGGTIALISGIYEHLIRAISSIKPKQIILLIKKILKPDSSIQTEIPITFLIVLVTGIGIGILSMSRLIPYLMEEYTFYTYSFFFGLILFSITIPYKKMDHGIIEYILMIIFAIILFIITDYNPYKNFSVYYKIGEKIIKSRLDDSGKFKFNVSENQFHQLTIQIVNNYTTVETINDLKINSHFIKQNDGISIFLQTKTINNNDVEIKGSISKKYTLFRETSIWVRYLWVFFVAAIAICAMILPGISGAYILVLFGEYQNILKALYQIEIDIILTFLLGIITGLLSFVRLLKYLLEKYHSYTMAVLTGFLIGSLNKIFPLKYISEINTKEITISIIIILMGSIILYILEKLSVKLGDPEPPI